VDITTLRILLGELGSWGLTEKGDFSVFFEEEQPKRSNTMRSKLLVMSAACLLGIGLAHANGEINLTSTGLLNTGVALKDGNVYVWGKRTEGQAGDGNNLVHGRDPANLVPTLEAIQSLKGGSRTIYALQANGDLYGWGDNGWGTVGCGNIGPQTSVPCLIMENVTQVIGGVANGFALDTNGGVWGWGTNSWSQLGPGSFKYRDVPVPIVLNEDARLIGGAYSSAFAVTEEGHVWVWGSNTEASLGLWDPATPGQTMEIKVPTRAYALEPYAHQFVQIGKGYNFAVGLLSDGRLIGWGNRSQLGIGDDGTISPEPVEIMDNVAKIHVALNMVGVLTNDGAIYTFGRAVRYDLPMLEGNPAALRLPPGSAVDIGGLTETLFYKTPEGRVYGVGLNNSSEIYHHTSSSRIDWPGLEIELSLMQ